jgi:hypothetical protein
MTTIQDYVNEGSAHWGNCTRSTGPRGGVKAHTTTAKVTGQLKTWKTRPNDFRLPVKHGMRGYGEIVPSNISQFHLPSECPLLAESDVSNERHVSRIQPVTVPMLDNREFYRVLCSCGFVGKEHFLPEETETERIDHVSASMLAESFA